VGGELGHRIAVALGEVGASVALNHRGAHDAQIQAAITQLDEAGIGGAEMGGNLASSATSRRCSIRSWIVTTRSTRATRRPPSTTCAGWLRSCGHAASLSTASAPARSTHRSTFGVETERSFHAASRMSGAGRLGEWDEIAPLIAFLCTPDAQRITAQTIRINGGMTA
jgi:hypothetical protein